MQAPDSDLDPDEFDQPTSAPRAGGRRRPLSRVTMLLAAGSVTTGVLLGLWVSGTGPAAPHFATASGSSSAASTRVVAARPTDTDARLILGAYHFNADDLPAAERDWLEVVRQNPRSAEAMYDLGFLYWASTPRDEARAQAMWQRVVEIDPSSELAHAVSDQLSGMGTPSATKS